MARPSVLEAAYPVVFGVATIACVAGVVRARRIEDRDTRRGLVGLLTASAVWSGSHVGMFLLPSRELKTAVYLFGLIFGFTTVFAWLYFCSAYTGRSYHRSRAVRRAALGLLVVVVAVKLANPIHGQYFTARLVSEPFRHLDIQQGAFHWTVTGLSYALASIGMFVLAETFAAAEYDTRPLGALVGLIGLPVVLDFVGYALPEVIDIIYAPLGVAVFAVGVLFAFEERFAAVQYTGDLDDPVVFLDDSGTIREANDAARGRFPALDGAAGESLDAVLPDVAAVLGEAPRADGGGAATADPGESAAVDAADSIVARDEGGETRYYAVSESGFRIGRARIGRMVVFSDVTAVERQRRELQRHDEQLDGVADAVTHELRNTVTIIRGHVSGAASAIDDGDATAARERLRTVSEAADRTGRIVNDLVTLAEYGQTVEDTGALDLPSVVERARRATDAGVNVSADDAVLEGAPDRVQALFENAIRFASHNGATTVTVGVGESEITIEDDGRSPFDDSDPERFFSYGDAVPNAEAGLTLPNVRSLARVHGWSTTVDTTYRGGTRIVVSGVDVHDGAA